MKSVRLLPVVIFAAAALLIFKGFGLVTNGGYVLLGTSTAEAAGGGAPAGRDNLTEEQVASMVEPTMSDTDPTAADMAPTLPLGETAPAGHGAAGAVGLGETEVAPLQPEATAVAVRAAPDVVCPPFVPEAAAAGGGHGSPANGNHLPEPAVPEECLTAEGDPVPVIRDENGNLVPYSSGDTSAEGILERLGERRTELAAREQELELRMALVEAAEKRINERTALLQQLEARINALVDQNKAAEEEQFKGIISMYESMKPKEAALIFNELDMNTLLRVAGAMNPRKMAPVMARMEPTKAKDLTAAMAVAPTEPTVEVTAEDLAALPQIVGQ